MSNSCQKANILCLVSTKNIFIQNVQTFQSQRNNYGSEILLILTGRNHAKQNNWKHSTQKPIIRYLTWPAWLEVCFTPKLLLALIVASLPDRNCVMLSKNICYQSENQRPAFIVEFYQSWWPEDQLIVIRKTDNISINRNDNQTIYNYLITPPSIWEPHTHSPENTRFTGKTKTFSGPISQAISRITGTALISIQSSAGQSVAVIIFNEPSW